LHSLAQQHATSYTTPRDATQIATLQGKHVLLRGLENARSEWELLATCHNLRKLHSHLGVSGLGSLHPAI